MDEFEKNVVSFDNLDEEPETGKTVEIETPKPAACASGTPTLKRAAMMLSASS